MRAKVMARTSRFLSWVWRSPEPFTIVVKLQEGSVEGEDTEFGLEKASFWNAWAKSRWRGSIGISVWDKLRREVWAEDSYLGSIGTQVMDEIMVLDEIPREGRYIFKKHRRGGGAKKGGWETEQRDRRRTRCAQDPREKVSRRRKCLVGLTAVEDRSGTIWLGYKGGLQTVSFML